MKNTISISLIIFSALMLSGCAAAPDANIATTGDTNSPYTIQTEFAKQFDLCSSNPTSCDLDRDQVFEGTITKIHEANIGDFSNFVDILDSQGNTSSIPLLPDTQQKRSTIIIDSSGNIMEFEDIKVGDNIKASVKSFDIIEAGQVAEKLGQYGYIQITAQ